MIKVQGFKSWFYVHFKVQVKLVLKLFFEVQPLLCVSNTLVTYQTTEVSGWPQQLHLQMHHKHMGAVPLSE